MISGEDARNKGFTKRYVEISRKKKNTNKRHGMKKLIDYDRWEKKDEDVPCLQNQLQPTKDVLRENYSYFEIRVSSIY